MMLVSEPATATTHERTAVERAIRQDDAREVKTVTPRPGRPEYAQLGQIARIDESDLRAFVDHLAEGARRISPDETAHLDDNALHARIEIATDQALRSGLEIQRDVMLYVLASLWLDPDFPQNMPDLYVILANPGIAYDERRHELVEAHVDRLLEEGEE